MTHHKLNPNKSVCHQSKAKGELCERLLQAGVLKLLNSKAKHPNSCTLGHKSIPQNNPDCSFKSSVQKHLV